MSESTVILDCAEKITAGTNTHEGRHLHAVESVREEVAEELEETIAAFSKEIDKFNDLSPEEQREYLLSKGPTFNRKGLEAILLDSLNTIKQVRGKLDKATVGAIAESIPEAGIINPITTAVLDEVHAERYLKVINEIWELEGKAKYTLEDLNPLDIKGETERTHYAIVIAGHQRLSACRVVADKFNLDTDNINQTGAPVIVHYNISAQEALRLQYVENRHKAPPKHQEALFIAGIYRQEQLQNPEYSMAECARALSISPDLVSSALRFSELPILVKDLVESGKLVYTSAVELSTLARRLEEYGKDAEFIERELRDSLERIRKSNWSTSSTAKYVRNRSKELKPIETEEDQKEAAADWQLLFYNAPSRQQLEAEEQRIRRLRTQRGLATKSMGDLLEMFELDAAGFGVSEAALTTPELEGYAIHLGRLVRQSFEARNIEEPGWVEAVGLLFANPELMKNVIQCAREKTEASQK